MKQKSFSALLSFLLIWVVVTASAWGGQVVTDEVRSWAKEALEQEKALETISAPNTVAVLYFCNKTEWSNLDLLQKGLTIMLMTDLSKIEEIQVVERVKLQALIEELDLGVSGLVESETASRVGRSLGAEYLVGGDIIKSKIDEFQLKSNLLKVPTEEIFGQPMAEGELLAELFRMEKDLLFEIIEELQIELSPELKAELRKFLTTNLQALLYLFQGIEQSDLGNYEEAAEFYQLASEEDPNLSLVEDFLRELEDLNLWSGRPEPYSPPERGAKPELRAGESQDPRDPRERDVDHEDSDGDGTPDINDNCPNDPNKTEPGQCGCGVPDTDSDGDGTADCNDGCPNDPDKTSPGICGCGVADTDTDGDGTADCNDGCPNDPNKTEPGICGCGVPEEWCEYPENIQPPVADIASLTEAGHNIVNDDDLWDRVVVSGEFKPGSFFPQGSWYDSEDVTIYNYWIGNYEYGLQIVGQNTKYGPAVLFADENTLNLINTVGFLAYAVQVEEDHLNEQIIEMAHHADKMKIWLGEIKEALVCGDIRARDALLTEQADAQSGRVLKDREGNWVRVQQYILRPNNTTVQLLNVCLRGVGDHAGLSTMDFTTRFTGDGYPLGNDLRSLPWNEWLDTQTDEGRYVFNNYYYPELDNMYVKFTNPGNEFLKEQRWFDTRHGESNWQYINREELTINDGLSYEFTASDSPGKDEYTISTYTGSNNNPGGFEYVVNPGGDYQYINVAFYVVGDGHTADNQGVSLDDYSGQNFDDIWDALRVNEGEVAPYIGNNNLEICIDNGTNTNIFSKPIDVVYIPMSRMLWKDVGE